jgi:hypothetical protein
MQIVDVLVMQISPFETKGQQEYLNPKLTSFQIMTCVLILLARGKVKSKSMGFLKFYNWQMLCWVVMSLFIQQHLFIFPFQEIMDFLEYW